MKTIIKLIISGCFFLSVSAYAEILTDGTMGKPGSAYPGVPTPLSGAMTIPQDMGTTVGNNLFHSFTTFNINTGESATFTGANTLQNVISRVTGGSPSFINGLLQSTIGNADFYFINPNGVMFGANAVVDVPAAFHVSTADRINAGVGVFYSATDIANSSTFSAAPESFGFVGTNSTGTLGFDGSQITLNKSLPQTLDVVASNITVANNAKLSVPAGEVRLVAIKDNEAVSLMQDGNGFLPLPAQTPTIENAGNVSVDYGTITTEGNSGGRLTLWGGDVNLNHGLLYAHNNGNLNAEAGKGIEANTINLNILHNSALSADALNSGNTGNVNVTVAKSLNLIENAFISANVANDKVTGNGGNVTVNAGDIYIDTLWRSNYPYGVTYPWPANVYGAGISSDTYGGGKGGTVIVNANTIDMHSLVWISSDAYSTGNGNNVFVSAKDITVNGHNSFFTTHIGSASNGGKGASCGNVYVKAESINLLNAGTILASNFSPTSNTYAGNIVVDAKHIKIDAQGSSWWTGILSDVVYGSMAKAGNIEINTDALEILNTGVVSSSAVNGDGTTISVPTITNGTPGDIFINAANNIYLNNGKIRTLTTGSGIGGFIQINSPVLTLDNNAEINATSISQTTSGNIKIDASILKLFNDSKITVANTGTGNSGNINILTGQLSVNDGSAISAEAKGGKTGNIEITATERLSLANQGKITLQNTGNSADTSNHGTITITAADIAMQNSSITTESTGNVDAGDININFSHWLTMDPSFIMTTANIGNGNGGDIHINGGQLIYLKDSGFLTSVSGATSNGGNIFVNAGFLIMDTGVIQANAIGGFGGDVNLHLNGLIASYDNLILGGSWVNWQPFVPGFNVIQAASETGVSGNVNITSPQFNISNITKALDAGSLVLPSVNRNPCQNSAGNSLKRGSKGGLPINEEKDDFIPAATISQTSSTKATSSNTASEASQTSGGAPCAASSI